MEPEASIESLMVRYQQGDFAAASAMVNRMSPQLHRFFLAQNTSRPSADDLLQETWMRIHQVRHTHRPGEPVLPWVYAIARHVRVDHYRKARRAASRELQMDDQREMSQPPLERERVSDLETLLATLPESQREVIAMLKVSGMSLEEVARATASSVGSVKQK